MRNELIGGTIGTCLSAVGTATQTNELLQTISLIITIVGGVITFIIVPLINWLVKAKADGKVDVKEIKEGAEIIKDGSDKIKEEIDKRQKGGKE